MKLLVPKQITAAMIAAGTTIAEPAAGETLWVSGGTYALGDKRIRVETHRIYECVQASTGRTTVPELDGTYWKDIGPTMRWAPFDNYINTPAKATTSLTYVLKPGFCNCLALYGIDGATVTVTVKAGTGGATLASFTRPVSESNGTPYGYFFLPWIKRDRMVFSKLPIHPDAEITVTISAATDVPVAIGVIVVGDYRTLVGDPASFGGTERGASAEPVTYSYIKTEEDGTVKIVKRHAATGLRATICLPRENADAALKTIQSVLDIPCGWVGTETKGYDGLNAFGLGSASVRYENDTIARIDLTVKGMI